MLLATKGIVLKTIKYGETSLICSVFTALFGMQSYIVKGVRTTRKSSSGANQLQIGSILEMVVYKTDQKKLNYIKEYKTVPIFKTIRESVYKNSVVIFMVELLHQIALEEEEQPALFDFIHEFLVSLDAIKDVETANLSLYLSMQIAKHGGYEINNNYDIYERSFVNLLEGNFQRYATLIPPFIDEDGSKIFSDLLHVNDFEDIIKKKITIEQRRTLLNGYLQFFQLHVPNFKPLKSVAILQAIFA